MACYKENMLVPSRQPSSLDGLSSLFANEYRFHQHLHHCHRQPHAQLPSHGSHNEQTGTQTGPVAARTLSHIAQPEKSRELVLTITLLVLAGPRILSFKSYRPPTQCRPKRAKSTKRPLVLSLHMYIGTYIQSTCMLVHFTFQGRAGFLSQQPGACSVDGNL